MNLGNREFAGEVFNFAKNKVIGNIDPVCLGFSDMRLLVPKPSEDAKVSANIYVGWLTWDLTLRPDLFFKDPNVYEEVFAYFNLYSGSVQKGGVNAQTVKAWFATDMVSRFSEFPIAAPAATSVSYDSDLITTTTKRLFHMNDVYLHGNDFITFDSLDYGENANIDEYFHMVFTGWRVLAKS